MLRDSRNFDRPTIQTYNTMRDIIIRQNLDIVFSDKSSGTIKAKTETVYLFFGGIAYSFTVAEISKQHSQVTINSASDISKSKFDSFAKQFFSAMDKQFPMFTGE